MREYGPLYDLIYGGKDYAAEADVIVGHVERLAPHAVTLLDVACGTGRHLEQLRRRFDVEGTDSDRAQLRVARERLAGVRLTPADMASLELSRRFDVVTCLFSAIGVMRTLADLRRAVKRLAAHVEAGGLLVVEPWVTPDAWRDGHTSLDTARAGATVLARSCVSSRRGRLSTLEFGYVLATPAGTRTWVERQNLRLSTIDELLDAFARGGLRGRLDPNGLTGRGLVLGVKPTPGSALDSDRVTSP